MKMEGISKINKHRNHVVTWNEGLHYTIVYLGVSTDSFIDIVNNEIHSNIDQELDLTTITKEYIIILDNEPYENHYSMMFGNVMKYLGHVIDIEKMLTNFLTKHNIVSVNKNDLQKALDILEISPRHMKRMTKAYFKHMKQDINIDTIEVLNILLHYHSIRGNW